jgi:alpha-glucosidase
MLLNVGLSGVPFAGVDVGGFVGDTTPELLIRWYEAGIFYPFFRNHCALTGRAQEPFAFSPKVEKMVRHLIEWRYKLLPYTQGLFYEHWRSGAPLMRPLAWHFADDERAAAIDDQFMFGPNIMVAPVSKPNETARYIYFPEGNWFALDSDKAATDATAKIQGSTTHLIQCPLGKLPAFVLEGSIIAMAEVMQSTAEFATTDITFKVFGDAASIEGTGVYFEDDGISLEYQQGKFNEWQLVYKNGALCAERRHGRDPRHSYFVDCGQGRKPFTLT